VIVVLVSCLLVTLAFVQKGIIKTVKASPEIHQGYLILTGNNVTSIEGRFDINGSIIVEDNATLILKDAFLNFTQTQDLQHNITLRNPSNGKPHFYSYNSTITSNFRADICLRENSTTTINNSTIPWYIYTYDYSLLSICNSSYLENLVTHDYTIANIHNSTIDEWHSYHDCEVQVYDSEINSFVTGPRSVNCTISKLKPGLVNYWDFITNCSVTIQSGGATPNVTLTNVNVTRCWGFGFYGSSNVTIANSTIGPLFATDSSVLYLRSTSCSIATVQASAVLSATDSSITLLEVGGSSSHSLINSTYTPIYFYGGAGGIVFLMWYLDVHVIDSVGQDVPSAFVRTSYPSELGLIIVSGFTDTQGLVRLTLPEKMMNATGEYPIGNYAVEATYETHSNSTIVNMTDNQEITLTLADFIIPEFPSILILPLFMIAIFLAVFVSRRRKQNLTVR